MASKDDSQFPLTPKTNSMPARFTSNNTNSNNILPELVWPSSSSSGESSSTHNESLTQTSKWGRLIGSNGKYLWKWPITIDHSSLRDESRDGAKSFSDDEELRAAMGSNWDDERGLPGDDRSFLGKRSMVVDADGLCDEARGDVDSFNDHEYSGKRAASGYTWDDKRALAIDMASYSSPRLGTIEEEEDDREPVFTKAYVGRLVGSLVLLIAVLMLGSRAGFIPPRGGMSVDTRVKWSISGVPKEMREGGLVPWWKVALISVNVDVDVVAGKKKIVDVLEDGRMPEGVEWAQEVEDGSDGLIPESEEVRVDGDQAAITDQIAKLQKMM